LSNSFSKLNAQNCNIVDRVRGRVTVVEHTDDLEFKVTLGSYRDFRLPWYILLGCRFPSLRGDVSVISVGTKKYTFRREVML
jgi:hypothetical protein